jgi:hypothetical protein
MDSLSVRSTPDEILKSWNSQKALADSLLTSMEKRVFKTEEVFASVIALKKIAQKLQNTHKVAIERAEYEDRCCYCSYRNFLTFSSTALDTTFQALTTASWIREFGIDDQSRNGSLITAASTFVSAITSKIKDKIWSQNEKVLASLAQLEEIIPNKVMIDHIESMIAFYESSFSRKTRTTSIDNERGLVSPISRGQNLFRSVVQRVVRELDVKKQGVKDRYVVKILGVYPRISKEKTEELMSQFLDLKDLMISEENVIREARLIDSTADVNNILDVLEEQLISLKQIFEDVDLILKLHEEIEKTRSMCVANGFRISVQFLIEMGSLASSIIEAIYAQSGASNSVAKIAGFSLYMINISLSWINTAISKIRSENVKTYKDVKRLDGQKIFERHIQGMIKQGRRAQREMMPTARGVRENLLNLIDKPPNIGAPKSPLNERILQICGEVLGESGKQDWKKYMPSSLHATSSKASVALSKLHDSFGRAQDNKMRGKRKALNIKDLYFPCEEEVLEMREIFPSEVGVSDEAISTTQVEDVDLDKVYLGREEEKDASIEALRSDDLSSYDDLLSNLGSDNGAIDGKEEV